MLSDDLVEDVISLEEEMASRSSNSSKTSSSISCSSETGQNTPKLNGKNVSADLLQLPRDNIIFAVSRRASRKVADELTQQQLIIQNRFRVHLRKMILPKLITMNPPSTSSTAASLPAISIDFKKFVDDLEHILGPNSQIPIQKAHFESRAIQSFMATVEIDLRDKGFSDERIAGVQRRLLELQKSFIDYLSNTDSEARFEKIISGHVV